MNLFKFFFIYFLFTNLKANSNFVLQCGSIIKKTVNQIKNHLIPVISIAGCSASGKTFFAKNLADTISEKGI